MTPGADNGATGSFTWELVESGAQGSGYATLSCTNCNPTTITAHKASDSCNVYNVQVRTNYGGFKSAPLYVAIERPKRTSALTPSHQNLTGGYLTRMGYSVLDMCGTDLANFYANENISNSTNVTSNNWPSLNTFPGGIQITYLVDEISAQDGYCSGGTCSPTPLNPGSPLGSTLIQQADQVWRVGSATAGVGMEIQYDQIRRYLDHGDHTSIMTPLN